MGQMLNTARLGHCAIKFLDRKTWYFQQLSCSLSNSWSRIDALFPILPARYFNGKSSIQNNFACLRYLHSYKAWRPCVKEVVCRSSSNRSSYSSSVALTGNDLFLSIKGLVYLSRPEKVSSTGPCVIAFNRA